MAATQQGSAPQGEVPTSLLAHELSVLRRELDHERKQSEILRAHRSIWLQQVEGALKGHTEALERLQCKNVELSRDKDMLLQAAASDTQRDAGAAAAAPAVEPAQVRPHAEVHHTRPRPPAPVLSPPVPSSVIADRASPVQIHSGEPIAIMAPSAPPRLPDPALAPIPALPARTESVYPGVCARAAPVLPYSPPVPSPPHPLAAWLALPTPPAVTTVLPPPASTLPAPRSPGHQAVTAAARGISPTVVQSPQRLPSPRPEAKSPQRLPSPRPEARSPQRTKSPTPTRKSPQRAKSPSPRARSPQTRSPATDNAPIAQIPSNAVTSMLSRSPSPPPRAPRAAAGRPAAALQSPTRSGLPRRAPATSSCFSPPRVSPSGWRCMFPEAPAPRSGGGAVCGALTPPTSPPSPPASPPAPAAADRARLQPDGGGVRAAPDGGGAPDAPPVPAAPPPPPQPAPVQLPPPAAATAAATPAAATTPDAARVRRPPAQRTPTRASAGRRQQQLRPQQQPETGDSVQTPEGEPSRIAQVAWQRFIAASQGQLREEELMLMSLSTVKSLLSHYGVVDPVECARVEVYWRLASTKASDSKQQSSPSVGTPGSRKPPWRSTMWTRPRDARRSRSATQPTLPRRVSDRHPWDPSPASAVARGQRVPPVRSAAAGTPHSSGRPWSRAAEATERLPAEGEAVEEVAAGEHVQEQPRRSSLKSAPATTSPAHGQRPRWDPSPAKSPPRWDNALSPPSLPPAKPSFEPDDSVMTAVQRTHSDPKRPRWDPSPARSPPRWRQETLAMQEVDSKPKAIAADSSQMKRRASTGTQDRGARSRSAGPRGRTQRASQQIDQDAPEPSPPPPPPVAAVSRKSLEAEAESPSASGCCVSVSAQSSQAAADAAADGRAAS
eukprot:TRINITY_DN12502_c2_g1_i2.p1 TRINITY_DN12502_c2_g1~~TRINITY_DN12502_c2_g1_i2.p1  ORF type:complete len:894 (+),score=103.89 TRINITY_DN12502_c2_g1_i2:56-2737(+)